jgi:hypothetical protein
MSSRTPDSPLDRARWLAGPLLAFTGLLAACRSAETFREPSAELPPALPVTLATDLRRLKEEASFPGFELTFKIGYLLGPLFSASDGRAFLSLVDSDLDLDGQSRPWPTRYVLSVDLQVGGKRHRLDARAEAESDESPLAAGREAIERCVLDLHRQARALLEQPLF